MHFLWFVYRKGISRRRERGFVFFFFCGKFLGKTIRHVHVHVHVHVCFSMHFLAFCIKVKVNTSSCSAVKVNTSSCSAVKVNTSSCSVGKFNTSSCSAVAMYKGQFVTVNAKTVQRPTWGSMQTCGSTFCVALVIGNQLHKENRSDHFFRDNINEWIQFKAIAQNSN